MYKNGILHIYGIFNRVINALCVFLQAHCVDELSILFLCKDEIFINIL